MHSRYAFAIMLCAMIAGTLVAYFHGHIIYVYGNDGFGMPSANEWISSHEISLYVNLGLNVLLALLLIYINRHFNLLRSVSLLYATMFVTMQGAQPSVTGQLYDGTIICLLVLLAVLPLYNSFQKPNYTRSIFLSCCIIGFGAMTDYSYVVYVIVFLLGLPQMRCLSLRGVLAMLLGVITPIWICAGFGIIDLTNLEIPQFVSIFKALDTHELLQLLVYTGYTLFLCILFGVFNMLHIYGYNARSRAYNGFWILLSLATVVLMVLDYYHLMIYLPMLNCCTSIQTGHFFVINNQRRSYFVILCLMLGYGAIYTWNMLI